MAPQPPLFLGLTPRCKSGAGQQSLSMGPPLLVWRRRHCRNPLSILLRLHGISTSQGPQASFRHLIIFVLVIVTVVVVIVVATIHQIDHQDSSLAHSIQLEPGIQYISRIKDASGEVEIDVGILECKAYLPEVLVVTIRQLVLFRLGISAIEDEDAFAER